MQLVHKKNHFEVMAIGSTVVYEQTPQNASPYLFVASILKSALYSDFIYSKYTRSLTFENLCQAGCSGEQALNSQKSSM